MWEDDTLLRIFCDFLQMIKCVSVAFILSVYRFFITPTRKSVKNEIVLVTGSARGLGRELSKEFAKLGAIVVLWDVDDKGNEDTARQIKELGGTCFPFKCDVSDRHAVYSCGAKVRSEIGDVSIIVNNAACVTGKRLLDSPDDTVEKTFNVNLLGHFWTVKCFLPTMLRNNHGHVVSVSSSVGFIGLKNLADYSASKFGVVGFTEVLNYEIVFAGYTGVHTTLVCPSYLRTGMFEGCKISSFRLAKILEKANIIRVANRLDPDEAPSYSAPHLDPNCLQRFPRIGLPLEVTTTADRIMQGILTNQSIICLPRYVYFLNTLKTIVPVDVMSEIIKFFGADTFMDSFVKQPKADSDVPASTKPNGCHSNQS